MKSRVLQEMGVPRALLKQAQQAVRTASQHGIKKRALPDFIQAVMDDPESYVDDPWAGEFAAALQDYRPDPAEVAPRDAPAPYRQWGTDLDPNSVRQMHNACDLPVAVRGALMPDAHVGYGLPIGGVLATRNVVIPYAVGRRHRLPGETERAGPAAGKPGDQDRFSEKHPPPRNTIRGRRPVQESPGTRCDGPRLVRNRYNRTQQGQGVVPVGYERRR
jgi:hypothetical protein